jgi:hypothetical protein
MAVHCGTCGERLGDATENGGPFTLNGEDFGGLMLIVDHRFGRHDDPGGLSAAALRGAVRDGRCIIENTCEPCAATLRDAVTAAARLIAAKNQERLVPLKTEMAEFRKREARLDDEKKKFEQEWAERRARLGL